MLTPRFRSILTPVPEHTDPPELVGRMTFRQILTP